MPKKGAKWIDLRVGPSSRFSGLTVSLNPLPFLILFEETSLLLSFRRWEIQKFVRSPYCNLNSSDNARSKYKQWIIAMDTVTRKVSLVGMRETKTKCWTTLKVMFDGNQISSVKQHPTSCKHRATCGQTSVTHLIQQCWTMLHQHAASIRPGLN